MSKARPPIVIEDVYPELDCGRYPVKREVGDRLEVWADIFKDGHDLISAVVKYRERGVRRWSEVPMRHYENDRWTAGFPLTKNTRYQYTIEAWPDEFETWRAEVGKKLEAGQRVEVELLEGREIVERAYSRSKDKRLRQTLDAFDAAGYEGRLALLRSEEVRGLMREHPDRSLSSTYGRTLEVVVDRERARYGAWYEMFPRSQGTVPGRSATFREAEARLDEISWMGFDVVYLTPIHPIGRTNRKGRNNALVAGPGDPGSPYAIGSEEGGHKAVHPELGTLEDFRRFVAAAGERGMEVALDLALQCSPDHPYLREHPDWFRRRPDGTIKYAENPPKKYEDIVNVDFYCEDWESLWREWLEVILFWVSQGVKIFRVDNPHTKPFPFWEWVIREVQERHPDVIFLSEAFTRPKVMKALAKLGFTQSYTYFTWRNTKQELTEYLTELTMDWPKEYMRPNFFANTHDILPHILQFGGRPAFMMRLVLAATLSPTYGIYSGYELCENTPRGERGTTVYYQDSEVYEYKVWDWDRPGNIKGYIRRVNEIRRENPALQELTNLSFLPAPDDNILFYGKRSGENAVFVAVNLDPHDAHDTHVQFPLWELGIGEDEPYVVEELITRREIPARGSWFWVRLDPHQNPAEIFRLRRAV
ncbi:alpha-1,4-glucan:maltose-1-phosphate maltosyltransferase [Rubrobacter xylanophilus]|uniref:Alpha-1,4-glucan:maltose-1-phosphate maltosyltransferase n=1 Tax=Rubrobacter xylanophilus TaxID=49319 RepID=A0A510HLH6_9ACTN|nr:alpha-1,4-glucan--maltose-1-phosphate maltosyltransferase [Rubrobacter xylanophilus]BBL80849.1 alpha-1,4-glucan:maltose-1-phosphate maltosyltransferase [Rubrobacter xylanophilus]